MEGDAALDREVVLAAMLRRLNTVTGLDEADIAAIRALPIIVRQWEAGRPIVSDDDRPTECCLVIEGFCVRAKSTPTVSSGSCARRKSSISAGDVWWCSTKRNLRNWRSSTTVVCIKVQHCETAS